MDVAEGRPAEGPRRRDRRASGQVFLGLTVGCARCHDHKFDPIPTRDYYRLQAVFATTQLAERPAPFLPVENTPGSTSGVPGGAAAMAARRSSRRSGTRKRPRRDAGAPSGAALRARARGCVTGSAEAQLPPRGSGWSSATSAWSGSAARGSNGSSGSRALRAVRPARSTAAGRPRQAAGAAADARRPADRGELEAARILAGGDPFSPGGAGRRPACPERALDRRRRPRASERPSRRRSTGRRRRWPTGSPARRTRSPPG